MTVNRLTSTLRRRCLLCNNERGLVKCGFFGCGVAYHCPPRCHRKDEFDSHISACKALGQARITLDQEKKALHVKANDGDPFKTGIGNFWAFPETRLYMMTRAKHVSAMMDIDTFEAVQLVLEHLMDMLYLDREDHLGFQEFVPWLLVRLGRDQDCYYFVKWWETYDLHGKLQWGDISLSILNVADEDILEPVDYICSSGNLSNVIAVTLLKVRLLLRVREALQCLLHFEEWAELPPTLAKSNRDFVMCQILGAKWGSTTPTHSPLPAEILSLQIRQLCMAIMAMNVHFWSAFLNPKEHLEARPQNPTRKGSVEEMQKMVKLYRVAWEESPGAVDEITAKLQGEGAPLNRHTMEA